MQAAPGRTVAVAPPAMLEMTTLDFAAFAVLVIVAWEGLRKVWVALFGTAGFEVKSGLELATEVLVGVPSEFANLPVPSDPHIEVALDPPSGLHYSNPTKPFQYENECTKGTYILFHAPTGPCTTTGPDGFDYAEYFMGKSRLWEVRIHMTFKKPPPPDEELFFGIQLEDYVPMSRAVEQAQKIVVAGIRQAVGGVYHSPGDNPARVTHPELEVPHCTLPLWAYDQFVVTPEGQEPPCLWDPNFSEFGSRRYKRIAEYAKEIESLRHSFKTGPTYTFAFWGNSRFLDVINWMVIGLPIVTPVSFNKFAGKPPVHVVLYSLKAAKDRDTRHLASRKTYYFRAALWSSALRPARSRFEALTGAAARYMESSPTSSSTKPHTLRRRFQGFMMRMGSCTGGDRLRG